MVNVTQDSSLSCGYLVVCVCIHSSVCVSKLQTSVSSCVCAVSVGAIDICPFGLLLVVINVHLSTQSIVHIIITSEFAASEPSESHSL